MKSNPVRAIGCVIVLAVIVGLPAGFVGAQTETAEPEQGEETTTAAKVRDVMEVLQADIETVRKSIIANALKMTDEESEAFWPVYNEYQRNLGVVRERQAKLLADYLANYGSISDEQAQSMLGELLSIKESDARVKKAYVSKFMDVLPARKVVRLYQVDNRLDTAISFELTKDIPLMW